MFASFGERNERVWVRDVRRVVNLTREATERIQMRTFLGKLLLLLFEEKLFIYEEYEGRNAGSWRCSFALLVTQ